MRDQLGTVSMCTLKNHMSHEAMEQCLLQTCDWCSYKGKDNDFAEHVKTYQKEWNNDRQFVIFVISNTFLKEGLRHILQKYMT